MPVLERQFSVDALQLPALLDFIEQAAKSLTLPPPISLKLQLLAEELFINTVEHGGPCEGPVQLALQAADQAVLLHYTDTATAYDPFATVAHASLHAPVSERPIGRLGVLLMQELASATHYVRRGNANCIEIQLAVPRDP
jgi:anti-sigma regulatory factor (Ser/Thr protein kinase)